MSRLVNSRFVKRKRKAGSRLELCFMLWVLSHFSCERPFCLTPAHHTVALRDVASDRRWLRRHTLLVQLQEAFHSARRRVPFFVGAWCEVFHSTRTSPPSVAGQYGDTAVLVGALLILGDRVK